MALPVSPAKGAPPHLQNFCQLLWLNQRSWGHGMKGLGNLPGNSPCHGSCQEQRWAQNVSAQWKLSLQHPQFPAGLEVTDEVLEKAAGTDVNNM